jgi:2-isopropylmalate synthase
MDESAAQARIVIYDTTLRDGCQGSGVSLTTEDKLKVARALDWLGVPYIEGGWPGSNPKDIAFFERARRERWEHARIVAFGSTRRAGARVEDDTNLQLLLDAATPTVTIVGKASRFQVEQILNTTLDENMHMVAESVAYLKAAGKEVFFDAEHFFDGYAEDAEYALAVIRAASEAGADAVVLCDTNGGTMTGALTDAVRQAVKVVTCTVGIHTHNDCELAVANSLAAVEAGTTHVQGTINGLGERVGNANLCSLIPLLEYKLGYRCLPPGRLVHLTEVSRYVAEVANLTHDPKLPFVGAQAFSHKAGLHVHAVAKVPAAYEHIPPEVVGNTRHILVSELSGRSNVVVKARSFGVDLSGQPETVRMLVEQIKELEFLGFWFEDADASLELLIRRALPGYQAPFEVLDYTVLTEYRGGRGMLAEATVKLKIGDHVFHTAAEGNGPVNALDQATRKALLGFYPQISEVRLEDYKVRVLDDHHGTGAKVRVWIRSGDHQRSWSTVGCSTNIIEASWMALADSLTYPLVVPVRPTVETSTTTPV